ncbi:MAG: PEP-CTERM sorting domain-containing protein [Acidobacteria bacterium]|nr:PEP-CTERM sorting domain-containing protein [Acidobacteriota bacterium]
MDHFMLLTAVGGRGAGSRLSVINPAQWAGDYKAAGVGSISLEVNNFSTQDIYLRLLFENPMMAPPTDEAITPAIVIPAGSGWVHVTFALDNLIAVHGTVHNALTQTTIVRIFHAVMDTLPGDVVVARVGVDNIRANAVPEPSTLALMAAGAAFAFLVKTRRR